MPRLLVAVLVVASIPATLARAADFKTAWMAPEAKGTTIEEGDKVLALVMNSQPESRNGAEADLTQEPLFPFGHGLSFTKYRYSNLQLSASKLAPGQEVAVSVDVENTGGRAGDEIVQVYVSDVVTSATWVNKALKGFTRVRLEPGEKKTVRVTLPGEAFEIVNTQGQSVVEPGEFEVLVGPSSRDDDLLKATLLVE